MLQDQSTTLTLIVQESVHDFALVLEMERAAGGVVPNGQRRDAGGRARVSVTDSGDRFRIGLVVAVDSRAGQVGPATGPRDPAGHGGRHRGIECEGLRLVEIRKVRTGFFERVKGIGFEPLGPTFFGWLFLAVGFANDIV